MRERIVLLLGLACAACTSSSGGSGGGSDSGQLPCTQSVVCTQSGSTFTCDCDGGTFPACPASVNEAQPCSAASTSPCLSCSQGAGVSCWCSDAGAGAGADGGGPSWTCIGSGWACQ